MKNTVLIGFFAVLIVLAAPMGRAQVRIEFDPQISPDRLAEMQTKIDFELWNQVVVSTHSRLTRPYPKATLTIHQADFVHAGCGHIFIVGYGPVSRANLNDGFYRMLTHEYSHATRCGTEKNEFVEEGLAEAETNLVYRELARMVPGRAASPCVWH